MHTSTDDQSLPPSSAAGSGEADHSVVEISRPATVTELVGDARCSLCRRQGSRCHVEQGSESCLQCSVPDDCIFERLIVKQGHILDFAWSDLIGQTSTVKKQPGSTVLPVKECLSTSTLPTIHEILQQYPRGIAPASHFVGATQHLPPRPPLHSAFSYAPRRGSFSDSGYSTGSKVSRPYVETVTGPQTEGVRGATSLEAGVAGDTSTVLLTVAAGSDTSTARHSPSRSIVLDCSECGYRAKTRSDLKKHSARHSRKFKCPTLTCPKNQRGFATSNDLDRHLKVVHKINNRNSKFYKCFGEGCTKVDKEWPRLDNFKQHLKKMHRTENEMELLQRSNDWYEHQLNKQREHDAQETLKEVEPPTVPLWYPAEQTPSDYVCHQEGNAASDTT